MLNLSVTEISLYGPGVHTLVREIVAGGMSQHVRMHRETQSGVLSCPGNKLPHGGRRQWPLPFCGEYVDPIVIAFELPQSAYLDASQRMGTG